MLKRLIAVFIPFFLFAVQVRAEYYSIKQYHIDVHFTDEGYADFDEVIEVEFTSPRHGIFRFIPMRDNINNKRVDRLITDVDVEGYKFSTSKENNNLILKIGDANVLVDGRQVYH